MNHHQSSAIKNSRVQQLNLEGSPRATRTETSLEWGWYLERKKQLVQTNTLYCNLIPLNLHVDSETIKYHQCCRRCKRQPRSWLQIKLIVRLLCIKNSYRSWQPSPLDKGILSWLPFSQSTVEDNLPTREEEIVSPFTMTRFDNSIFHVEHAHFISIK